MIPLTSKFLYIPMVEMDAGGCQSWSGEEWSRKGDATKGY